MTPEQIELCQRLAAEAAQYRWAREMSDDSRRAEAEEARVGHRVGYRCDPKATHAWWACWQPAYEAALATRATPRPVAASPDSYGGEVHRQHARTVVGYARQVLTACEAFARKAGDGPCWRLAEMSAHLDRIEAWTRTGGFVDVSAIVPACVSPVPSLPWVVDPLGTMRHLGHMVATGLPDQWAFHAGQARHAAAHTLASLDDPARRDRYRAAIPVWLEKLRTEVAA
jgi:hypothetical protein